MKTIFKSLSVVLLSLALFGGCEGVKDIIPVPSMKATVDGESWISIFRAPLLFKNNNVITITGTPEASQEVDKAIILTINGSEAGTYVLDLLTAKTECGIVYKKTADAADGGDNYYIAYEATATISKIDKDKKQISGTFSGKLRSAGNPALEVVITNGTFENLNYQERD